MATHALSFFASTADLTRLLAAIEANMDLQYVRAGLFDKPTIEQTLSFQDIPNFGVTAIGDMARGMAYVVCNRDVLIQARPIPQRGGGMKYAVDQLLNPKCILFYPGGMFKGECIISGQVGTSSGDETSLALFQVFRKEIQRQFVKIKSYYVGKIAEGSLDGGARLTSNVRSPQTFDLTR